MKKCSLRLFLLTVLAVVFIFTGCVPAELCLRELPENPAVPVTVAALLPLTGSNRIYAEQMSKGLLCAEERINNCNGISGRKLKLEIIDTAGTAGGTREALLTARKLGASGMIAGYDTEEVSMIIADAAKLQMPVVIPLATSNYHMQVSPFVYRNCFSDTQQMEALANYLLHWREIKHGAIVTDQPNDDDYSRGISRCFGMAAKDIGVSITREVTVPKDSLLTKDQLTALLMSDPGFIMVSARARRSAQFVRQLRQAGFSGIICGADSWDDSELCAALEGIAPGECVFTSFFNAENQSAEYRQFCKRFRERFFYTPGACETQSYDALIFLAIGLDNAENLFEFDRNWRSIAAHPGAAAVYTMLKKGEIDRTIYLKVLRTVKYDKTIRSYPVLTKKLQYSKLQDYRIIE